MTEYRERSAVRGWSVFLLGVVRELYHYAFPGKGWRKPEGDKPSHAPALQSNCVIGSHRRRIVSYT
jgi:hypothetical protein